MHKLLLLACFGISPASASVLTFLSSPQTAIDTVTWGQLGSDQSAIGQSFTATSASSLSISGTLSGSAGLTSVVCDPVTPVNCSWGSQPSGYSTGDTLIWAEDTNNAGSGPITLSFAAQFGLGAYVQATAAGQFSAVLSLYNGASLLGTHTYTSDADGDPLFLGATDVVQEITKGVVGVVSCGSFGCDSADLSIDTLQFYGNSAPEPGTFWLAALLFIAGLTRIRRPERNNVR